MPRNKITCIIPAYNEGPRIETILQELTAIKNVDEIIAINDGSTDDTLQVMKSFEADPRIKVLNHVKNQGKGHSVAHGVEEASNEVVVLLDADMAGVRAEHIEEISSCIIDNTCDLALVLPHTVRSFHDILQSYVGILSFILTGFRAFRRTDVLPVLDDMKKSRYGVDVLVFNYFVKKRRKVKLIKLSGITFPTKVEKLMTTDVGYIKLVSESIYQYLAMLGQVAKSGVEYPPVPSLKEIREAIKNYVKNRRIDAELFDLMELEKRRQVEGLELIASENYVSVQVLEALGSPLTNKYSEGYPKRRYYEGNKYIDEIEILAQKRALRVFDLDEDEWGVNVQPYSGSPANQAVYFALLEPGDRVMGLSLPSGGHLTHGWKANFSSKFYNSVQYRVKENGEIDYDELEKLAVEHKPRLIWAGATAYTKNYDYKRFAEIARKVGAYFAADIAHVAGLIVAGVHNSPFEYADVVTTTTHKTLRGPRGAMIFARKELLDKINSAVFPGLQGGPHNHQTAAIAVALGEALQKDFVEYGKQVVNNAKRLAEQLQKRGINIVGGGTENHLMLLDFSDFGGGRQVEYALEIAGITVNKNTIPGDKNPPYYPSGVRIGTPALTSRGMKEDDMDKVAEFITRVVEEVKDYKLPEAEDQRGEFIKKMKEELMASDNIKQVREEVREFAIQFPVPGITE